MSALEQLAYAFGFFQGVLLVLGLIAYVPLVAIHGFAMWFEAR